MQVLWPCSCSRLWQAAGTPHRPSATHLTPTTLAQMYNSLASIGRLCPLALSAVLAALTSLASSAAARSQIPLPADESLSFETTSSRNVFKDLSARIPAALQRLLAGRVRISPSRLCRSQSPSILIWISFSTCLMARLASIPLLAQPPVRPSPTISVVVLSLSASRCRLVEATQVAI